MKFKYLYIIILILAIIPFANAAAPVADFNGNMTIGGIPLAVEFTDASTNTPTGWSWLFGDEAFNKTWILMNASSTWIGRIGHTTVALSNRSVILMGGGTYNDSYISTDKGANWTLMNSACEWTGRAGAVSVLLTDGSIITAAGGVGGARKNDTWRSTNSGKNWTLQNSSSGWFIRDYPAMIVIPNGDILLMGGRGATNYNDVWKSSDKGLFWTRINASAGWSARYYPTVLLAADQSIILYGGSDGTRRNDTWRSTDNGVTWTNITVGSPPYARLTSGVVLPDGSFIITGGGTGATPARLNETWRSINNGRTWTRVLGFSGYTNRSDFALSILADGSVLLTGGTDGGNKNDNWRYSPYSSTTQNPTYVFLTERKYNVTLRAYNADGYNDTTQIDYITATSGVVTANFTSDITSGSAPLPVQFYDGSTGVPTAWTWNATNVTNGTTFTFNTSQNPLYTFGVGNFSIKLNASNSGGYNISAQTTFINVSYLASQPISTFTTNTTSGVDPLPVQFNDTSINVPIAWQWNATNVTNGSAPFTFSNIQNASRAFGVGNFSIKLYTSNTGGSNVSTQVTFINVSARLIPVANFTSDKTSGIAPLSVQFNDTSTNSPTSWVWFFGDENYTQAWTLQNDSSGWDRRISFPSVLLSDNSIVIMGGINGTGDEINDTWRSIDNGTQWTLLNASSGWQSRYGHTAVVLSDNSIVLMGGDVNGVHQNDVWRSTNNGATWTLINASAGWTARDYHTSVVASDGSIILIGGRATPGTTLNDTWRSIDKGVTWTQMSSNAGWLARYGHTAVGLKDSIVIMGGVATIKVNDTWRSTNNGATWTLMNASSGWAVRGGAASVTMPDNSIITIGGVGDGGTPKYNDTWRSDDNGLFWTLLNASNEWSARSDFSTVVTQDASIILMGGGYLNDTWKITPAGSSTVKNPLHTYTSAGFYKVYLQATNTFGSNLTPGTYYVNVSAVPIANFTSNVTTGNIYPLVVKFYDGSQNFPTTWNWSFGDGRWFNTTNSSLKNPTYQYDVAQKYDVTLLVTNPLGSHSITKTNYINLTSDDDANVTSWLHMNGTSGSTIFSDEKGIAWARYGTAQISTLSYKYGGASGQFNSPTGSYISTANSSAFTFGTKDFTIEMWVNVTSLSGTNTHIISKTNNPRTRGWGLDCSGGTDSGWDFWMGNDSAGEMPMFTIPNKTWTHIAIERQSGTLYVYVNGNLTVSKAGYSANLDSPDPLWIARQQNIYYNGYIDEVRISNGVARWKSNFTPPYNEYRGLVEINYPDINSNSTFRYKTNPDGIAYIDNQTQRNRTLQIQNISNASYVVGQFLFDPAHGYVKSVQLNTSYYPNPNMTLISSSIDNIQGTIDFNISKPTGFSPGTDRASILDYTIAYVNYSVTLTDSISSYFGYGYLINESTSRTYFVHNFLGTPPTYGDWNFTANFTATNATVLAGTPTTFNATFNGSYPNRWNWTFGDGTFDNTTNSLVTHTYTIGGLKTVTLTEYLWQNGSVNNTKTRVNYITVTNLPTLASFTSISSGGPLPPVTVQFTDTSTNYPTHWNWSFGDGSYSSLQNPTHVYNVCGDMSVSFVVNNTASVSSSNKTNYLSIPCFIPTPPPSPDERIAMRMGDIESFVVIAAIILVIAIVATFIYMWAKRRS